MNMETLADIWLWISYMGSLHFGKFISHKIHH